MVLPSSVGKQPNQAVLHTANGQQAFLICGDTLCQPQFYMPLWACLAG